MTRTYNRDSRGRFAGGGGGGSSNRGPVKVGRSGPRGGKTGTRAEQRRNAKAQQQRYQQFNSKTTAGRSARDAYKAAAGAARAAGRRGAITPAKPTVKVNATPAKPPKLSDTLRSTLRSMAQSDARFYREIEQITGKPLKVSRSTSAPRLNGTSTGGSGRVSDALRSNLRRLAQADAARLRDIADMTKPSSSGAIGGSKRSGGALPGGRKRKKKS